MRASSTFRSTCPSQRSSEAAVACPDGGEGEGGGNGSERAPRRVERSNQFPRGERFLSRRVIIFIGDASAVFSDQLEGGKRGGEGGAARKEANIYGLIRLARARRARTTRRSS